MKKDFFKGDNDNKFCTVGEAIERLKEAGYSKDIFLGAEKGSCFYYIGACDAEEVRAKSEEMYQQKKTRLKATNIELSSHIRFFPGMPQGSGESKHLQLKRLAAYASKLTFLAKLGMSLQRYENLWVQVLERRIVKEPYARIAKDGLVMITTGVETNGEWWKGERNEAKKLGLEALEEVEKEVEDDDE